ncbi:macrophage mannose receptor 1-like [Protopterus annectens]|uniref:macrophage mannose receptor 1-like n=1 Tax=Protopterus annectens TaxID=7888 RepID=UPI001CF9EB4B|nr:macrophage mannose receptor 1-like [Protopterus annectens]
MDGDGVEAGTVIGANVGSKDGTEVSGAKVGTKIEVNIIDSTEGEDTEPSAEEVCAKGAGEARSRLGASLISIQDHIEYEFIHENIEKLSDKSKFAWIGLFQNVDGDWIWLDKTTVAIVNWDEKSPSQDEYFKCVEMSAIYGTWRNTQCKKYNGFICKMNKITEPTETPQESKDISDKQEESAAHSLGIIFSVTVLIVVCISGTICYFYRKRQQQTFLNDSSFDNTLYFNTDTSARAVETRELMSNIEYNEHVAI